MASADLNNIASLAQLLQETAEHHGHFEALAPPHDWWDWYAAYMMAREAGSTPDDAAAAAGRYMAEVKHIVVGGLCSGRGSEVAAIQLGDAKGQVQRLAPVEPGIAGRLVAVP